MSFAPLVRASFLEVIWDYLQYGFPPPYCNVLGEGDVSRQQLGGVANLQAFLRNCVSIAVCTTKILCTSSVIRGMGVG